MASSKRNPDKEARLRRSVERVEGRAGRITESLLRDRNDPRYNVMGDLPWGQLPSRERAAFELTKGVQSSHRAKDAAGKSQPMLGMVVMMPRLHDAAAWESMAAKVHSGEIVDVEQMASLPATEESPGDDS